MSNPLVVFHYRKTAGRYALNVLAGALQSAPATRDIDIAFAESVESTAALLTAAAEAGRPVLVGWSFYSPQFEPAAAELARVRTLAPGGAVHVAGGAHASAQPEITLRAGFDLVAIGEGEPVIVELARRLRSGEPLAEVPGIASLENDRLVRRGRGMVENLDDWPAGAPRDYRFGPIEITRGCIYACKFCQTPFFGKARFRHRSVAQVRSHVEALAILRRYVDNDNLIIGGQSGALSVLDRSGRGHDVECIRDAVRLCLGAGFKANVDFLFGLPGETGEKLRQSLDFAEELARLGARIHGHAFMPLPGTPYKEAPPARLSPETERILLRLASHGKLYGPWQTHVAHAERLAGLKTRKPDVAALRPSGKSESTRQESE